LAGQSLVIHGPPGTGKSQTIANLIAALVAHGRKVLFVAEKRAAIDAVLSRLKGVELGDMVLDIHEGTRDRCAPGARAGRHAGLRDAVDVRKPGGGGPGRERAARVGGTPAAHGRAAGCYPDCPVWSPSRNHTQGPAPQPPMYARRPYLHAERHRTHATQINAAAR
jgi:hypothetical protein